jgi:hypothetical protein
VVLTVLLLAVRLAAKASSAASRELYKDCTQ